MSDLFPGAYLIYILLNTNNFDKGRCPMEARIIDGKAISENIKTILAKDVIRIKDKIGRAPGLAVILVGDDPASATYVSMKEKTCRSMGIFSKIYKLPGDTSEIELISLIDELNDNAIIDGLMVQLPLPSHICVHKIINRINPKKDVDGLHPVNIGNWMTGRKGLIPCTPRGLIKLIETTGLKIEGCRAVVIGRSEIVGKPTAALLINHNATVTVCHSRTNDLAEITRTADIIVSAAGKPKLIKSDMVKHGAIVIDVGTSKVNGRLVGDVDFESVKRVAGWITPVPGGVGPMTIAMLMQNTIEVVNT
jgi:methylenetetrahydrofolate dehydrogenase (NADP+)/methenyltetrahydrofolate cyclohydrolase